MSPSVWKPKHWCHRLCEDQNTDVTVCVKTKTLMSPSVWRPKHWCHRLCENQNTDVTVCVETKTLMSPSVWRPKHWCHRLCEDQNADVTVCVKTKTLMAPSVWKPKHWCHRLCENQNTDVTVCVKTKTLMSPSVWKPKHWCHRLCENQNTDVTVCVKTKTLMSPSVWRPKHWCHRLCEDQNTDVTVCVKTKTLARSLADPTYQKNSSLLTDDDSRTLVSLVLSPIDCRSYLLAAAWSPSYREDNCASRLVLSASTSKCTHLTNTHTLPGCSSCTASTSKCTHFTNTHTSAWLFVLYCEHLQMYTPHQYSHICLVARPNPPNSYKIACLCFKAVTLSLTFFAPVSMDMHAPVYGVISCKATSSHLLSVTARRKMVVLSSV